MNTQDDDFYLRRDGDVWWLEIFVNMPRHIDHDLSDDEVKYVEAVVTEAFRLELRRAPVSVGARIVETRAYRGCVIVAFAIGVAAGRMFDVLKDYENFRSGVLTAARDVQRVVLWLRGEAHTQSAFVKRIEPTVDEEPTGFLSDDTG